MSRYANYHYGIMMPVAAAFLKLALFVLWALPTYKSTVEMLEMRERRLGLLPDDNSDKTVNESAEPEIEPAIKTAKSARTRKARAPSQKQTRMT